MQPHITHLSALLLLAFALLRTAPARGQQTLFNVPTGASTAFGAVFAQEQLNLARRAAASSTTFDVGLGHGLELGINVAGITAYGRDASIGAAALGPCVMANIQESLALDAPGRFRLGAGAQVGTRAVGSHDHQVADFAWLLGSLAIDRRGSRLFAGGYHSNRAFGGSGFPVGALAGLEVVLVPERLALQLDYLSGKRVVSAGVVGLVVELPSAWQVSVGLQVPTTPDASLFGLVLEVTQKGIPLGHREFGEEIRLAERANSRTL